MDFTILIFRPCSEVVIDCTDNLVHDIIDTGSLLHPDKLPFLVRIIIFRSEDKKFHKGPSTPFFVFIIPFFAFRGKGVPRSVRLS